MFKVTTFSFTEEGRKTEESLHEVLKKLSFRNEGIIAEKKTSKDVKAAFINSDALIFIGAAGIAVRLCAPYLKDKLSDPAIIVIDELAGFVIPIASGHVGGANSLSRLIAKAFSAQAVITTATDVEGVFSVDEFAAANDLLISEKSAIKHVAKKLLSSEPVSIAFSDDVIVSEEPSDGEGALLHLLMRPYVVGMGCKKGKDFESLEAFFLDTLKALNLESSNVIALATIDVKKDEPGLLALCERYNLKFVTYSADELNAQEGEFPESAFVKETVGVSNVSMRAAKACGGAGKFLVANEKRDGMTISVFEKYRRINLKYE